MEDGEAPMFDDLDGDMVLDDAHLEVLIAARRCMLAILQGREVIVAPETSPEDTRILLTGLAGIAAGQMVAHARQVRGMSKAEAEAESVTMLEQMITGYELAMLDGGRVPPPAPVTEQGGT